MEEQEDVPELTMPLVDLEVVLGHMVMVEDQVVEVVTQVEHLGIMCTDLVVVVVDLIMQEKIK